MTNHDEQRVALAQARALVPADKSWGVHLVQAAPRDTVFLWADSPQEAGDLLRLLPYLISEPDDPQAADGEYLERLLKAWKPEGENLGAFQAGFNQRFGERYELLWLGPFSELRSSDAMVPQWVRELFWFDWVRDRSTEIEPADSPPVPDELVQDFALWLGDWSGE
jgi:hypothetical protein